MDHLPLPKNPRLDPVIVRYKCTEPYDGGPALSYPERHGWEVLYSPWGIRYLHNGQEPDIDILEGFLQNWLYFGLLHETFGDDADLNDFITEHDEGFKIITTAPLNDAIVSMEARLKGLADLPDDERALATAHIWTFQEHTWRVTLNSILRYEDKGFDGRLWATIAVLAESIEIVAYNAVLTGKTSSYRVPGNPPIGGLMVKEMKSKGWCPFDVKRIDCTSKSMSALYYLSNMQPPRSTLDHSKCSEYLCAWMSIGPGYRTKHTVDHCECEGFKAVDDVLSVLTGEGIPLIQMTDRGPHHDGQKDFQIIDSESGIEFVAISHVWAEGLGNPHSNSLPPCTLRWVSDLVDKLTELPASGHVPFWVDTICVPIAPKEMHTRAMNRLRHPYEKAQKVLVLDSYLYTQVSTEISDLEIWCRVLLCSWSQRLWTFQESRLSKSLWFQFADGALALEDIFLKWKNEPAADALFQETMLAYRGHNVVRKYSPDFRTKPDIRDMRESLKGRAVSVASDEALCIFANMFLDMKLVTSLPADERMAMFWKTVDLVPIGLVFSTTERKLTFPGLHWAPESFMGELDTRHWLIEQEPKKNGFYTPNGLEIDVCGYLLDPGLLIWDDSFDTLFTDAQCKLRDENGVWYFTELSKPWNPAREHFPGEREQLAILLISPIPDPNDLADTNPFNFSPGMQGVIGVVTGIRHDGVPLFQGYRHILLHRFSKAMQDFFVSVHDCVEAYVEETCQIQLAKRLSLNETDESEPREAAETPATFLLTDERRVEVQRYAEDFARTDPKARDIALKEARIQGRSEEQAIQQYGFHCRFQLQMRLRTRIVSFPPTTKWCID